MVVWLCFFAFVVGSVCTVLVNWHEGSKAVTVEERKKRKVRNPLNKVLLGLLSPNASWFFASSHLIINNDEATEQDIVDCTAGGKLL